MQKPRIEPEECVATICRELDLEDWKLEFDKTDLQVYSRSKASNSNIIGFKTISYHALPLDSVLSLLKDVCNAMNNINDMFVKGEVFREWPSSFDKNGTLVRTSFKMPFPLKNREFLHGLHYQALDPDTHIISYTPIRETGIPVQKGYLRCDMFCSGQRVNVMENGLIRVEHLMVYRLGGLISEVIQDKVLKASHIKAYIKEWRNLRSFLFPPKRTEINYNRLKSIAYYSFEESEKWPKKNGGKVGSLKLGRLQYAPYNAFKLDLEVKKDIQTVSKVLADESLKYLGLWNREFKKGEIIEILEEADHFRSWLMRVEYNTPKGIDNRIYTYYFSREWLSENESFISYCSVDAPPSLHGKSNALLYPSFHRCIKLSDNRTKIEHLLATDLQGRLGRFQDRLLRRSLIKAQFSDMEKQRELFAKLEEV